MRQSTVTAFLTLIALLACACGTAPHSSLDSANEPHRPTAGHDPWFEGWYARATDLGGGRSLAVIVASHKPAGSHADDHDYPGYIGILYSEGHGAPTRSWTFLPQHTRTLLNGQPVDRNPNIFVRADQPFTWQANGFGSAGSNGSDVSGGSAGSKGSDVSDGSAIFSNEQVTINVPGQIELNMQFADGKSWNPNGLPLGPEGYLAPLPVPLHWYVKSLSSPTMYRIKVYEANGNALETKGMGYAHLEKNWGQVFPKAWNWLQGLSTTEDTQVVLGGGVVGIGPLNLSAWLAGYRSAKEQWDIRFSDLGTKIKVDQDDCAGRFHFNAQRPGLEVDILAAAAPSTFGPVAVPTADGFVPNDGAESFSAQVEVRTYRVNASGKYLSDRQVFNNAALEFGAGSYCKSGH